MSDWRAVARRLLDEWDSGVSIVGTPDDMRHHLVIHGRLLDALDSDDPASAITALDEYDQ